MPQNDKCSINVRHATERVAFDVCHRALYQLKSDQLMCPNFHQRFGVLFDRLSSGQINKSCKKNLLNI